MPIDSLENAVLRLSDLAPGNIQSEIRAMSVACAAVNGINLAQGICDTPVPAPVEEGAIAAIRQGHNTYTRLDGIPSLRESIARKLQAFNHLEVDPEREVLVTAGATGAMHAALMALLNPGDECIVFQPFYGYHVTTLTSLRIKPVVVPLDPPGWILDPDRLRAAVSGRTRGIILNTPGNPSGKVLSRSELKAVAEFALRHNLFVFTDEMYENFIYGGRQHLSLATLPGMRERTVTISGFSKVFSVTGWRLGYLTADPRWTPAIGYFHDLTFVCAPAPLQHGAAAGLDQLPRQFYSSLIAEYEAKRDQLCSALTQAGLTPCVPDGAYYILADVTQVPGDTAKAKARTLLANTGLAAVAGSAFFVTDQQGHNPGENLLRFCFAKRQDELTDACRRLEAYRPY